MIKFTNISFEHYSSNIYSLYYTTQQNLSKHLEEYINNQDVIFLLAITLAIFIMKYILERYLFVAFGKSIGIKSKKIRAPRIKILETAYKNKHINNERILELAKQLDCSVRGIERWLRLKRSENKSSVLKKFCESGWRCFYYTIMFIYGLIILHNKSWFWDINKCYYNLSSNSEIWWYYMISMAFYIVSLITQFFDTKRKDFWQLFIHHIVAIALLYISWEINFVRLGSLIILIHDVNEIFLEMAKMANYANYTKLFNIMFFIFVMSWFSTRIGIFPFHIIYSSLFEAPKYFPKFPLYTINMLLCLLFTLHLYWTYLIIKLVCSTIYIGQIKNDIRSDIEDVSDEDEINEFFNNATNKNNKDI